MGFAAPLNLVHMPALSVPAGFTPAGLPVGLQIAGRKFSEALLLRTGYAIEQRQPLFRNRPTEL
jgi:Asp-tRNA(Asn)/Glu-tRNA(Gln) amidotransferase A subunit family amidase